MPAASEVDDVAPGKLHGVLGGPSLTAAHQGHPAPVPHLAKAVGSEGRHTGLARTVRKGAVGGE
jgi:hypothetical protein